MAYDPTYSKRWRVERARGITRTIPADRARTHAQMLMREGRASLRGVAEAAGLTPSGLGHIVNGNVERIRHETAQKILQTTLADVMDRGNRLAFVPNVGARRRIQGLLALGWRHEDITAAMQPTRHHSAMILSQRGDWIARETHDAVKRAFAALSASRGGSNKTRGRARALGYLPPLAWDDETIDDPNGSPFTGSAAEGDDDDIDEHAVMRACQGDLTVPLTRAEHYEAFRRLREKHVTLERMAELLGTTDKTISRWVSGETRPIARPARQEAS